MRFSRLRTLSAWALSSILVVPPASASSHTKTDPAEVLHALNRLTFGPRPGDVQRVTDLGLERWIDLQLHPERIPDADLAARLASLHVLQLPTDKILAGYDPPPEMKRELQKRRAEMENGSEVDERAIRRELREKYAAQMQGAPRDVENELQAAKVIRAVHSERQLDELLVDFWMNHFNVYAQKGPVRFLLNEYEQQVVRPHAWGKFEDLLKATAESPAMLFYLDNWLSVDPNAAPRAAGRAGLGAGRGRRRAGALGRDASGTMPATPGPPPQRRRTGLNENYARELMELHTLGVDGGYTQQDVTEVARAFTGWTIKGLRQQEPQFAFDSRVHDAGDRTVLGQTIKGGGKDEGERILHLLATHPKTAHFIAYKLARRFVSDEPPAALVERAAATFLKTDGDIREVLRTIVTAREFMAPQYRAVKVKTPLEFVVSAVRAAGGSVKDGSDLARRIGQMGMPLYMQQPPTGYKDTADAWVSTSGLLARLNFALELADGRVRGLSVDAALTAAPRGLGSLRDQLATRLLPGGLSERTRATLDEESSSAAGLTPTRLAGLMLGSPEFQRR
jgi:uncharacterized protein (DUF1800 family)